MSILIISDTYLPLVGGAELHVYYLAKHIRMLGYDVEILTGTSASGADVDNNVTRLNIGTSRRCYWKVPFILPKLFLKAKKFDILHAHYSYLFGFLTVIIGKVLRKKTIITLHGMGTLDSSVNGSFIREMFRSVSISWASMVIATSPEMESVALRFTKKSRVVMIENGVDLNVFKLPEFRKISNFQENLELVTLRRLVPKNGVQYAVDTLIRRGADIPYRLTMIGDGPLKNEINNRIVAANLTNRIHFKGTMNHEEVIKYLSNNYSVALFLSTAESFSLAALECMALGCILLTSNAGAYPDLIVDGVNGYMVDLFEAGSSDYNAPQFLSDSQYDMIIEKLNIIKNTDSLVLKSISDEARRTVENRFSWNLLAAKTISTAYLP